jgi:L-aspartate oxidase
MIGYDRKKQMKTIKTDVIIAGCGLAGLYTALSLDKNIQCVVLNKTGPEVCNSMYAQGGIAAVVDDHEDLEQHVRDTLVAGAGLCDEAAVRVLVYEAQQNIEELVRMQVPFDRVDGHFQLTREGGHAKNRILHSGGDATGLHMTQRVFEVAKSRENITIVDNVFLADIITGAGRVAGIVAIDADNQPCFYAAPCVVIASGGIGRVYRNSTNASCITGDGIAAAMRAGAEIKDMEFVQFHPTALVHPDSNGRFFLISEALRGEGAILRNRLWEPFMQGVHPLADLAPRDIVSRAIILEMKKYDLPHVYLDITAKSREFLKKRFPTIYDECMHRDIDIAIDWIPVMPVQHYFMGGIHTDLDAKTNIPGLYACGESACTGVQGANRLASNSLLECLVFGRRCAQHISTNSFSLPMPEFEESKNGENEIDLDTLSNSVREMMTKKCSIIRSAHGLKEGLAQIGEAIDKLHEAKLDTVKGMETYNIATVAQSVLQAALQRKKSVGAHYRMDDED